MFYAHFVLAKKGPLARIWLAAHWDKKLTKAHVYETNIEQSVDGIMQPKVKMALRTSGHLLLGVVRIYSRKAKYLLADCNEAFVKIKMAFRPGMVDLPEDKREAAMNAITLPDVFHDFDTEMADLEDMDMHHQFALNHTRVEEITMREDYGNITLSTEDDGFGDGIDMEPPEMLRDTSHMGHFGDELSLGSELSKGRDQSHRDSFQPLELTGPSTSGKPLDAPIQDDGFGGVGLVQDLLSGGLFEGGSLFEDQHPAPESPIGGDDFAGPPSPMHSDDSRPPSPLEESVPEVPAAPQLDQTPVPSSPSRHSPTPSVEPPAAVEPHETTTLLHNEEESFALAPVEASVLKGEKRKRKRKLVVDDIKAITGEGMKAQLSDSADIITTLDIAPPTKRLMHWKETGGVEELFNLPSTRFGSRLMISNYQNCMKLRSGQDEEIRHLAGVKDAEKRKLNRIGMERPDEAEKKARAPGKRKRQDSESVYAKRQQELARQQEEFARQELMRQQNISLPPPDLEADQQLSLVEDRLGAEAPDIGLGGEETDNQGLFSPARSAGFPTPARSAGFPTPAHRPDYELEQSGLFGSSALPAPPPADLTPAQQTVFTEQWVSRVTVQAGGISPQYDGDDHSDGGAPDYPEDEPEEEEDEFPADIEPEREGDESEMMEDETIEQFEDRVLNKRAAQMHVLLDKRFGEERSVDLGSLLRKNHRKQAAQKFYSILVLQKVMAVNATQSEDSYGPITVEKGPKFMAALQLL